MFGRNLQERIDATPETGGLLLPEKIVQEHPHGVEPNALRPAEFEVDALRIESSGLSHLEAQ